jgi:hypothetical protein
MRRLAIVLAPAALLAGAAAASPGQRLVVHDPLGDTGASDLDRTVALSVDGPSLRARIVLAGRVRTNAIYSVRLNCQGILWRLSAKKVAGETTISLFNVEKPQLGIPGVLAGRTVSFTAAADAMACAKGRLTFSVTAQGTNGRAPMTDRLPQSGDLTYRR